MESRCIQEEDVKPKRIICQKPYKIHQKPILKNKRIPLEKSLAQITVISFSSFSLHSPSGFAYYHKTRQQSSRIEQVKLLNV